MLHACGNERNQVACGHTTVKPYEPLNKKYFLNGTVVGTLYGFKYLFIHGFCLLLTPIVH